MSQTYPFVASSSLLNLSKRLYPNFPSMLLTLSTLHTVHSHVRAVRDKDLFLTWHLYCPCEGSMRNTKTT